MSVAWIVYLKEVRESLRDRRVLMNTLLLGPLLGPVLFLVLMRNPAAIDAAASLAALYLHFAKQSYYVTGVLEKAARHVRRVGEERYNAQMVAGPASGRTAKDNPRIPGS